MDRLWNFLLPFFSTPTNYAEVLQKLAGAVFYETYVITLFLRDIPQVGALFRSVETYGSLGAVISAIPEASALNVSGFAIAGIIALLSHILQLHDRISDFLGIRRRFDRNRILVPLAKLVGVNLAKRQLDEIIAKRETLMRDLFYRYASSRADNPVVDRHDIEHALAAWSWLWVFVEGIPLFTAAGIAAHLLHSHKLGVRFLIVACVLLLLAVIQQFRLAGYARAEIEAIASDPTAADRIRTAFNAL